MSRWFRHGKWPKVLVRLHYYTIVSFVLLMVSGIALVNPSVHTVLIPYLSYIYQFHILLGLIFAVTLLTPFTGWIPKGKPIRRLDWLFPTGLGTIIVITGVLIWLVTAFPTSWRSAGFVWHGRISYLLGAWLIVHAAYKAFGFHPNDDGVNARLQPERRMFLRWIGGGIAGTAVLAVIDPIGILYRWLQSSSKASGGGTAYVPSGFAEYYTVIGKYPQTDLEHYRLTVNGLVSTPVTLTWSDLKQFKSVTQTSDFHCVTGWSVPGVRWTGIHLTELARHVKPSAAVAYVNFYSFDGAYTESMRLEEAYDPSVLLAIRMNGQPLRTEQGFPVRLVVPKMYGYKSIKWVSRVEFSDKPLNGFWEQRGYASEAYIHSGM